MTNGNLSWLFFGVVLGALGVHLFSSSPDSGQYNGYSANASAIFDKCLGLTGNTIACAAKAHSETGEKGMQNIYAEPVAAASAPSHPPYSAQETASYDECLAMTSNTIACAAKIRNMKREAAMKGDSDGWLNNLPVPPGSSVAPPALQKIHLLEKTGFKMVQDKAWISGRAWEISLDDNHSNANGSGGIGVEITVDAANDPVLKQCEKDLQTALPEKYTPPETKEIIITGAGRYKSITAPNHPHGLYVFELSHLTECKLTTLQSEGVILPM